MKKINKIIFVLTIFLCVTMTAQAHGGNITGWKEKNSDKIVERDGKHYGYHKQEGERHYHEVQWNEEKQKWEIVKTAVYYDENLNKISLADEIKTEKIEVKFAEKVDGDTAKFDFNGEVITVRFLGIDTPETVHPTKAEEPFGKEASDFTEESLQNANKIELQYDTHAPKTDQYNRHLAWIWVDDSLLQAKLLEKGLAKTYMLQDNYAYAGILQESEENARMQKKGIWFEEENKSESDAPKVEVEANVNHTLETILLLGVLIVGILLKNFAKKAKR